MEQNNLLAAEDFLRESFKLRRQTLPDEHWLTAVAKSLLGECLTEQKLLDEAEILLIESLQTLDKVLGKNREQPLKSRQRLDKMNYLKNKMFEIRNN